MGLIPFLGVLLVHTVAGAVTKICERVSDPAAGAASFVLDGKTRGERLHVVTPIRLFLTTYLGLQMVGAGQLA